MNEYAIGIDIGGTRTKAGLVDLVHGKVLETLISPTEKTDSDRFLESVISSISKLKKTADAEKFVISGVGFGVTGFVFENGTVDSTYGFLEFMEDYPLTKYIETNCSLPCRADNDARVVALGEALYGKGKGYERVLVLTLGTGLGLGLIAGGRFETILPYAHMGGHISVRESDFKCYCGKSGCLESLVSSSGLTNAAERLAWNEKYPDKQLSVEAIFLEEQKGNPDAKIIIAGFLKDLKTGIDNYINLFAPDIIIIGGGIAKGMGPYLDRINTIGFLTPYKSYKMEIALSELDEHSGILGSAALFRY